MRINIVKFFLLFFFLAILLRLLYWQFFRGDELLALAEGQHFESQIVPPLRGDIYFSDDSILATLKPAYLLYGSPKLITPEERNSTAKSLAKLLWEEKYKEAVDIEVEKEEIDKLRLILIDKLSQDLYWVALEKDIDQTQKEKIENLNLKGLGFEEKSKRFYPEGSSSAHLLGFVGSDSKGENTGYFGLEGFYNGELKGLAGKIKREKDALGLPILIGRFLSREVINGKSLKLNIDRSVQYIVEESLKKGLEKYGAKSASVVVMDPKTGDIIALAAYPNYNPESFNNFPKENYKNPVVAESYEPGSTFKVLTMAAGINEGVVSPDTKCDICSGPVEIGGFTIKTWDNKYRADSTMTDVIIHSDNTGMVFVSKKLGLDKMYDYIEKFGMGNITNIDLQDESSPDLRSEDTWREIDLATASFGQGIAVTPIQMVTAVSAICKRDKR
jgi:stage V sporulation protein D (sporulation-specific penicillin-binding protein)